MCGGLRVWWGGVCLVVVVVTVGGWWSFITCDLWFACVVVKAFCGCDWWWWLVLVV